ncbi:MAG: [FeFe] hydrogenase H-cluster radical SAM maturase HydE, partial [Planctomycetota bacterium]|nr:[FeFe] hydrogenase H-cluster radical SAM maturase HydE [Planctomycetota bacterium]
MLSDFEIARWLRENDTFQLENLWQKANLCRRQNVGDEVHIRGLIEISNYCRRRCRYCGLNAERQDLARYRMARAEILACCQQARAFGYGTVVLQAGEDEGLTMAEVAALIKAIKAIPA